MQKTSKVSERERQERKKQRHKNRHRDKKNWREWQTHWEIRSMVNVPSLIKISDIRGLSITSLSNCEKLYFLSSSYFSLNLEISTWSDFYYSLFKCTCLDLLIDTVSHANPRIIVNLVHCLLITFSSISQFLQHSLLFMFPK